MSVTYCWIEAHDTYQQYMDQHDLYQRINLPGPYTVVLLGSPDHVLSETATLDQVLALLVYYARNATDMASGRA